MSNRSKALANTFKLLGSASLLALLSVQAAAAQAPAGAAAGAAEAPNALEEVIVTGTRLGNTSFTTPTPVTTLGSEQIATRGQATAVEALNEIPSFRNATGPTRGTGGTFAGGQGLPDLRGLNPNRTLALVDGRRHVPNNITQNTNGTWDTNVLPAALIDRIDVVTGGASAAYGSDAVAGVVNFILNDRLEGFRARAQVGISQENDAETEVLNLAWGAKFAGGRGHVIAGFDYSNGERSGTIYSRSWGQDETGLVGLPATRAAGLPAFLKADHVHYAIPLSSLITSCQRPGPTGALVTVSPCPIAGQTFGDNGQPRPFLAGDPRGAVLMVGGEGPVQPRNQLLATGSNRQAGLIRVTYDFSDKVAGWGEFSGGRFHNTNATVDYVNAGSIVIQRNNPFLPAALGAQMDAAGITQFNLSRTNYLQQGGLKSSHVNEFWQGAAGVRAELFDDWKFDAYVSHGRSKFYYRPQGLTALPEYFAALYTVPGGNGAPVCGPVATNPMYLALGAAQRAAFTRLLTTGCVPFNPFGARSESQAAIDYVAPNLESLTKYDQTVAAFNVAGSPFKTWAGDVSVAFGAEWRRDKVETTLDALNGARSQASAFFAANPQPGSGKENVKEGYFEAGVPIAKDLPFAKSVDLNGAVRVTDYSVSGSVTTWKLGGTWDLTDDIRLRVTRSKDIRAPGLNELFYRGNDGFSVAANPVTGRSNQINSAALNNPNLKPEKADTLTVGVVLQPHQDWARGFKASIDFYSIDLKGVIGTLPVATIVNGFYLQGRADYAQFITFDPSQPAGFSRVDPTFLNLNSLKTSGLDVNATYSVPDEFTPGEGAVTLNFSGTRLYKYKTFGADGSLVARNDYIQSKYRWTTNVNYRLGGFSTTLTARYFSSFHGSFTQIGPDEPAYNPALPTSSSDNLWPAMVYYSLQAEYAVKDDGDGRKVVVYGIVDNLLNKNPPAGSFVILEGLGSPATNFDPYDNVGRYFKLGVRITY